MAVQFVFPIVLVPGLLFYMPESPRWLIEHNKNEKAEKAMRRLIGPDQEDKVELEIEMIQKTTEAYSNAGHNSWMSIFKNRAELRKAWLGFSLQGMFNMTFPRAQIKISPD